MRKCLIFAALAGLTLAAGCGGEGPVESREFLVGAVLSLDGTYNHYGTSIQKGIEMAIDEINSDGGINSVPFKVEIKNSQSTRNGAAAVMNELIDAGYEIVIGAETTDLTAELIPLAASKKVILMTPSATSPSLRRIKSNGYFFRMCPTDDNEAQKLYEELTRAHPRFPFIKRSVKRVLALVLRNNAYSDGLWDAFGRDLVRNEKLQYEHIYFDQNVAQEEPGEGGYNDQMKGIIAKVAEYQISDENVEETPAVVIFAFADDVQKMLRAFKREGFNLNLYCSSSVDTVSFLSGAAEYAEGLVFPRIFDPKSTDNPKIVDFVGKYKAIHGTEPDLYAAYGYDCAKLIALTLRREFIDEYIEEPRNFRLQMNDERFDGLTGRVDFSQQDNEVIKNFLLYKIIEGVPVFIDEYENQQETEKYREMRELRNRRGVGE
ncbi:MAG TPA: ABC transporter substrate-binding protein [Acidobacteriota bacterium]|nr:ABC transporter substrate-binding protein [Acidobacteriota bacterium]